MKEQDKQLLLTDLCARLPYGVRCNINWNDRDETLTASLIDGCIKDDVSVRPYLRPMLSMTEEEKEYIKHRWCYEDWPNVFDFLNHYQIDAGDATHFTDWLNEHHFDYRGLIEMGLALVAPEDMYKTE